MNASGNSSFAWANSNSGTFSTYVCAYNQALSTQLVGVTAVDSANPARHSWDPDIAMDDSGKFDVAYGNTDVYVARYSASGSLRETPFIVNTTTANTQQSPAIAVKRDTGDFAVAWQSQDQAVVGALAVVARRYSSTAAPVTGEYLLNQTTAYNASYPAIAMSTTGNALAVWQSYQTSASNAHAIYGRWMPVWMNTSTTDIAALSVQATGSVVPGESVSVRTTFHNPSFVNTGSFSIQFYLSDDATITTGDTPLGGPYTVPSLLPGQTYVANYNITLPLDTAQGTRYIGVIVDGSNLVPEIDEWNNTASQAITVQLPFSPVGVETGVNTTTLNAQSAPAIAMRATGDYVIAWSGDGPGDPDGVFFQRYNAQGQAQGVETRANTTTSGAQTLAALATNKTSGDFVVVWAGNGAADADGIYFQRYDASGNPQGGETLANGTTTGLQTNPTVGMDDSGNFVIAWRTGSPYTIYARRFSNSGAAMGGEFRVDTPTYPGDAGNQDYPSVSMNGSGSFVVAWQSALEENVSANLDGVYFQRFDSSGARTGSQTHADLYMTSYQSRPSAALADNGVLVVAWQSSGQEQLGSADAANYGVYFQRYDANNVLLSADNAGSFYSGDVQANAYAAGDQNVSASRHGARRRIRHCLAKQRAGRGRAGRLPAKVHQCRGAAAGAAPGEHVQRGEPAIPGGCRRQRWPLRGGVAERWPGWLGCRRVCAVVQRGDGHDTAKRGHCDDQRRGGFGCDRGGGDVHGERGLQRSDESHAEADDHVYPRRCRHAQLHRRQLAGQHALCRDVWRG